MVHKDQNFLNRADLKFPFKNNDQQLQKLQTTNNSYNSIQQYCSNKKTASYKNDNNPSFRCSFFFSSSFATFKKVHATLLYTT